MDNTSFHFDRVAIFGGADIDQNHPLYQEVMTVAARLGELGKVVINGGGPGVMQAATAGAQTTGGKTVAVTFVPHNMPSFEGQSHNNRPDEEVKTANYVERMFGLMEQADIFICFRGGTGTISEWATAWLMAHLQYPNYKPLILYGHFWHQVMQTMIDNFLIDGIEQKVYRIVENADQLFAAISQLEQEKQLHLAAG